MELIDRIKQRMIECFASEDPAQIAHTLCVHSYTRMIAVGEAMAAHPLELLEIAALLHDIGCPAARARFGDSKPPHQEAEGARIVEEWLRDEATLSAREKTWLVEVVGSHHRQNRMMALEAMPLFEADLVVNLQEGYFDSSRANEFREKLCVTKSGRTLMSLLWP